MAWKQLRPSTLRTVCKSMYVGALISLLTATIIGSVYVLISYLCNKTINNCELHPKKSIPSNVQWMRSVELSVLHLLFFYGRALPISLSSSSGNGREKDTRFGFLFWILLVRNLYHSATSLRNISFQTIFITTDSRQSYPCH